MLTLAEGRGSRLLLLLTCGPALGMGTWEGVSESTQSQTGEEWEVQSHCFPGKPDSDFWTWSWLPRPGPGLLPDPGCP